MVAEMNRTVVWIVAACLTSVASPVAAAPDAASARAFVEKLYSHYPSNPNRKAFDPTGKNASQVFDPGMIAAFREDTKLANGEVGFVEADHSRSDRNFPDRKAVIFTSWDTMRPYFYEKESKHHD
jgi:hypothetical protein